MIDEMVAWLRNDGVVRITGLRPRSTWLGSLGNMRSIQTHTPDAEQLGCLGSLVDPPLHHALVGRRSRAFRPSMRDCAGLAQ